MMAMYDAFMLAFAKKSLRLVRSDDTSSLLSLPESIHLNDKVVRRADLSRGTLRCNS